MRLMRVATALAGYGTLVFQVEDHHLPVDRLQAVEHCVDLCKGQPVGDLHHWLNGPPKWIGHLAPSPRRRLCVKCQQPKTALPRQLAPINGDGRVD